MSQQPTSGQLQHGASAVITHRVSAAQQPAYEQWLQEISSACKASAGMLDWHMIRPIAGYTDTYTVVIRYDSEQHLKQWMASDIRQQLIAKVENLLSEKDSYQIKSGLDFWFVAETGKASLPVRWKQFLLTWSAIFPLVSGVSLLLIPLMDKAGLPQNHLLHTFLITGVVVGLMVYVVMPRYTKLVRHWLHG
jgi:uncharacterized protein